VAYLKNTESGDENFLFGRHIVGKLPESNTILSCADSSPIHAIINWRNGSWQIKDISTKGTYINGIKMTPTSQCRIQRGDEIKFGNINGAIWTLLNEDPPQSMLIPISPNLPAIVLSDKVVALPSTEKPFAVLSKSRYGYWICESPEKTHELKSGDLVGDRHNQWQFVDWNFFEEFEEFNIEKSKKTEYVSFLFNVSQDEEHVSLTLQVGEQKISLGERSHHYLLLLLARKKLEDKMAGVAIGEQGWILTAEFTKMLGLSERHINIQIHRIRKQLIGLYPSYFNDHSVVERRIGALRLVGDSILIHGGLKKLAHFQI
jgi:hypothetical protein